jgi:hypothetical protein
MKIVLVNDIKFIVKIFSHNEPPFVLYIKNHFHFVYI